MIQEAKKTLQRIINDPNLADQYTEEEIEEMERMVAENWKE